VDDSITTESERVSFLKTVSQLMASRARIKLNMRRLYAADGHAVKELLKIASVLYQATKRSTKDDSTGAAEFHLSTKAFDVKQSRHLASEITTRGAALYDMLEAEHELKDLRQKAINRNLDSSEVRTEGVLRIGAPDIRLCTAVVVYRVGVVEVVHTARGREAHLNSTPPGWVQVEGCVREAMSEVHDGIRGIEDMLENLDKDKRNLESKIEKRKADLGRKEKQLSNLEVRFTGAASSRAVGFELSRKQCKHSFK
jgi:clusterin-associated protein 1